MGKYSRVSPESDPCIQGCYRKVISVSEQEKSLVWHFINTNSKTFMWTCKHCVMLSILTKTTLKGFLHPLSCPSTVTDHTISCYPSTHILQWTSISVPPASLQGIGHVQIIRPVFRYFSRIMTHSNHLNRILIFLNEYDTFKSYDSSFDISQGIGHSPACNALTWVITVTE